MGHCYYLVIDFEATCCDQGTIPREETEIIEVGAVMVDVEELSPVDEFASFIRPVRHPQLTKFCTDLTSITQPQVDDAPGFADVISALSGWAAGFPGHLFCSWGDYDRNQLRRECQQHDVAYPFGDEHMNVKRQFAERRGLGKGVGMAEALKLMGVPLDGTHHRGIDDARNIAKLLPYAE